MSELQLALIVAGAVIICGVWLFNWVQERNLRRRLDKAFGDSPRDVLLPDEPVAGGTQARVEPRMTEAAALATRAGPEAGGHAAVAHAGAGPAADTELDCIAEIESDAAIAEPALGALLTKLAECGRRARVFGLDPESGAWQEAHHGAPAIASRLRVALQLVDRSGTVNAAQLAMFCDAVRACAAQSRGRAVLPEAAAVLAAAESLDAFCSKVDVAIGVNVVAPAGGEFAGARIRELAEGAGFRLEPEGVFHYRDAHRRTLFTLDNQQPAPFVPERLQTLMTGGVTLTLDVPRVADGLAAMDRMIEVARELAAGLDGQLVDDNRNALSAAGIERIRDQLASISAQLSARGIPAGGDRALRLFS